MYASADQLYAYLDQLAVSDANTALLTDILSRASAKIDRHIAALIADPLFTFAEYTTASTKIVTSYGGLTLPLPAHSIGTVTLVEYENTTSPSTWVAVTDSWEEQPTGILYRAYGWGYQSGHTPVRFRVTASWGYGEALDDIESMALSLAVNMWRAKTKGGFSETIGNEGGSGGIRVVAAFTKDDQATLQAWADLLRPVAI